MKQYADCNREYHEKRVRIYDYLIRKIGNLGNGCYGSGVIRLSEYGVIEILEKTTMRNF